MKEFINEIGKRVNEVAEQIGKAAEPLVKKTEDVVEVQKLRNQVRVLEKNNDSDLCDLGEIVYVKYKEDKIEDEDLKVICKGIDQRVSTVDRLEKEIASIKGVEVCEECEMALDKGVSYCSNCGAKVSRTEETESTEQKDDEEENIFEEEVPTFEEGDVVEAVETEDLEVEIELVVESIH